MDDQPVAGEVVTQPSQPSQRQIDRTMDMIEGEAEKRKMTIVAECAGMVMARVRIVLFRGRTLILEYEPFAHYAPLSRDKFDRLAYPIVGGVPRSRMGDIYAYVCSTADDLTDHAHMIGFGQYLDEVVVEADTDIAFLAANRPTVWDMRDSSVAGRTAEDLSTCVWRSPYPRVVADGKLPFIMQLAGGSDGVYDDIMQSIAPIVMEKKPDGVVWWIGAGANGKSTLMDALYRIFPGQLASINVKRLADGRDTPGLNGKLANVVKESSDGRVDDTEIYKALGTHENFRVHRFHSQDDIEVNGNIHSIFSGNSVPVFADKGHSIRRRTFIIPFAQQFKSDPDFERRTFTPEFFGQLANEICKYSGRIKAQGYRYKWSAATLESKAEYDKEASNAEEYARQIINEGVVAFTSYNQVRLDYDNWCADNGYPPLGVTNLRKAMTSLGFERFSRRGDNDTFSKFYKLRTIIDTSDFQQIGMGRPGLMTLDGFTAKQPDVPPKPEQTSILNHKW